MHTPYGKPAQREFKVMRTLYGKPAWEVNPPSSSTFTLVALKISHLSFLFYCWRRPQCSAESFSSVSNYQLSVDPMTQTMLFRQVLLCLPYHVYYHAPFQTFLIMLHYTNKCETLDNDSHLWLWHVDLREVEQHAVQVQDHRRVGNLQQIQCFVSQKFMGKRSYLFIEIMNKKSLCKITVKAFIYRVIHEECHSFRELTCHVMLMKKVHMSKGPIFHITGDMRSTIFEIELL